MIFTPQQSQAALDLIIAETGLQFEDSSYKNDLCDTASLEVSDDLLITIGFPNIFNREPEHEEEFNTFLLNTDYHSHTEDSVTTYETIDELIKAINEFKKLKSVL